MNEIETIKKMINAYDWAWVSSKALPCDDKTYVGLKQILFELTWIDKIIEKVKLEDDLLEWLAVRQYVLDNGHMFGSELPEYNYDELITNFTFDSSLS